VKRRTVKVLLLEDDEHLGEVGEVVEVRAGFARNFLLPAGKATEPTVEALRRVELARKRAAEARALRAKQAEELARGLAGMSLTLQQRASEEGHLFGSVGAPEIAAALRERGVAVQERQVELERPIKELGIYSVSIRVDAERRAEVRVWVIE
jgi:large subunit ribosomal protein L9